MIKDKKDDAAAADAATPEPAEEAAAEEAAAEPAKTTVLDGGPREHIPGERAPGGDLK